MKLNIKQLTGPQFFVEIDGSDSIAALKKKIFEVKDIPVNGQCLIYSGRELADNRSINYYKLEEGHTIHLVIRKKISPTTSYGSNIAVNVVPIPIQSNRINLNDNDYDNDDDDNDIVDIENAENDLLYPNGQDDIVEINLIDVIDIARMCRLIRIFSILDIILMIVFAFWGSLLFLCGIPLIACGYYGAKTLKRVPLFIYGVFVLLSIGFRIYLAYLYSTWIMIALIMISTLLELYIFRQIISVFAIIPQLSTNHYILLNQLSSVFI